MTKVSTVPNREEDNIRSIDRSICLGVRQTIYVLDLKGFKIINVFDVIVRKALDNSMGRVLFINVKDIIKEMPEDIGLVITCDRHDEVD